MSDNTESGAAASAADLLGGDGATTTTTTDTTTTTSTDTKAASEPASWLADIDDADLKTWATNKNFPSVKDALASAKSLETLLGREKLPLPKDDKDAEGYDRVYKALGRPDEPAGYALDKIEGAAPEFAGAAAEAFHKAGLSTKQGAALAGWWNEQISAQVKAQQEQFQTQSKNDLADLGKEWGSAFDANVEHARRAARQFGLDKDAMAGIEQAIGTKRLMQFMSKVGSGVGEDKFEGGDNDGAKKGFGMSPDQAKARLDTLMKDRAYSASYISGDADKRGEIERLNKIISGEA